jgi:hypothetical protein
VTTPGIDPRLDQSEVDVQTCRPGQILPNGEEFTNHLAETSLDRRLGRLEGALRIR